MVRPKLSETFAQGLALAAKKRGWKAYVPLYLGVCLGVASGLVYFVPDFLWTSSNHADAITIYVGIVTFDGLLLAIGWGAFSKIYELIGSGPFAKFLRRNGLLNYHILFVDLAQISLVVAALCAGFGLFSVLLPLQLWFERVVLTLSVSSSLYAILKCVSCTEAMHDLLWEAAEYEDRRETGNVVPMNGRKPNV